MKFNVKKCKTLRITRRTKHKINFHYRMSTPNDHSDTTDVPLPVQNSATDELTIAPPNGYYTKLEEISHDKYLGVILDNKLSFNQHVDAISNKATRLLNLCRRNLAFCSQEIKTNAYKSLIRPHLEYASPAWNPYTSRNIDKIEAIQRRAARFALGYYTYGPDAQLTNKITNQLKWQSLQHRRTLYDLSIFYKILHNNINISFPPTVKPSPHHINQFLHIQSLHSDAHKYSFYSRTIRIWNLLPSTVTNSTTIDTFKNQSAQWISPLMWKKVNNTWTLI